MINPVFSVFDSAAKAFLPFFVSSTQAMAQRAFREAINTPGSNFSKYAADYTLFEIGEWDDSTGSLDTLSNHVNLGNGLIHQTHPDTVLDEYNPDETLRAISIAKEATS